MNGSRNTVTMTVQEEVCGVKPLAGLVGSRHLLESTWSREAACDNRGASDGEQPSVPEFVGFGLRPLATRPFIQYNFQGLGKVCSRLRGTPAPKSRGASGVFDSSALLFFAIAAGAAFLAGLRTGAPGRAVEAAILAPLGGLLARTFVGLILSAGNNSPAAALTVGWAFFLWPGVIDTLLLLLHVGPVFTAPILLWTAAVVGSFSGMMDGLKRIHPWHRMGAAGFLLDATWGLAGSTNGCLLHLVNFAWADAKDEPRRGAHRYFNGFCVKAGYAITLGSVMSNLPAHADGLLPHEMLHVWQNRLFGPFYTLTYLAWMTVLLLPAVAAGLIMGRVVQTVEDWCYLNNPWENWAYTRGGWRDPGRMWGAAPTAIAAIGFFLGAASAALWIVWRIWLT